MNISDVLKKNKYGFARPNLFRVQILNARVDGNHIERLSIHCFQAQIPGTNILTTDRDIGLRQVAYQRAYADMMMGFYCSGDLKELEFFQNWMDKIVNKNNNHMGYYSPGTDQGGDPGYTSTVLIEQLTRDDMNLKNQVAAKWQLEEAFPKQIDPIQLDYGTNDIYMAVTITMTFRKFIVNYSPEPEYSNAAYAQGERDNLVWDKDGDRIN